MSTDESINHDPVERNAKLQRRIQRYGWDAAAQTYDTAWEKNLHPAHQAMFEMADVRSGESVFEIACGSGFATMHAATLVGSEGQVLATDISAEMINILQARIESQGLKNVIASRAGAETTLPEHADKFDVALCALGLMFFPEPNLGLENMWNALKPDGRAATVVWGQRSKCRWAEIFPIVNRVVELDVCPLFFSLGTGETLTNAYKKQGFKSVQTRRINTSLHYEDKQTLLKATIDGGAVALAAKRFNKQTRRKVESEFLESVKNYRENGSYSIPAEFVVVAGSKPF